MITATRIPALTFVTLILSTALYSDTPKATIGEAAIQTEKVARTRGHIPTDRRIKINMPISYKKCPAGDESPPTASAEFEVEVLRLVNEERRKRGIRQLTADPDLTRAARYHANDMVEENYFSHDSQDREDGKLVPACRTFERIGKFASGAGGENIAAGQRTPASVMDSWMKSPGHKRNILSGAKRLGVGVAKGQGGYGIYWVQNFGY